MPSASVATAPAERCGARKALVVDDDPASRRLLERLLRRAGYEVVAVAECADALVQFNANPADIVFLDIHAPGVHALHVARHIKALAGDAFVPVVVVSGAGETSDLVRAIEAGADDFVTRPVDERVLRAKVLALERIGALHRRSARLHARTRADWEVAQTLLGEVIAGPNARSSALHVDLTATDTFSADVFLAEFCPSGDLNVLLGDFTGHGLAAALTALPTAEIFRSMTAKGFAPQQILLETNRKLKAQLPTGKFLAAAFVRVSRALDRVWVANCGMPDLLVLDADGIRERITSAGLPLGIEAELDVAECLRLVPVAPGQRLLLASDGVHEAFDSRGESFGRARVEQAATEAPGEDPSSLAVKRAFDRFRDGEPLADDASLVEIRLVPALFEAHREFACTIGSAPGRTRRNGQWRVSIELHGDALRVSDPVPMLLSQLQEIPGLEEHRSVLYTVLSELFSNALEHGVLQLSSRLKDLPDGFDRYAAARERELAALSEGRIELSAACVQWHGGGELTIRVEDSGAGFDSDAMPEGSGNGMHGLGLQIVRGLCRTLRFENGGRCACAVYAWGRSAQASA